MECEAVVRGAPERVIILVYVVLGILRAEAVEVGVVSVAEVDAPPQT
jgi:hypothetical protein